VVQSWTPDGEILFESSRHGMFPLHSKFYVVSPRGGLPRPLALPQAYLGNLSADGGYIAYQETMYYDPE